MFTLIVSNFLHQFPGRPVPAILDGAPFAPLVVAEGTAGTLGLLQGSSVVYARVGTGARMSELVRYWLNPELEEVRDMMSRDGVGS